MTNQEKLEKFVKISIKKSGINTMTSGGSDLLVLATMVGPLYLNRVEWNNGLSSIYMTFEFPDMASRFLDCNPITGEWNINAGVMKDVKKQFSDCLEKLLLLRR